MKKSLVQKLVFGGLLAAALDAGPALAAAPRTWVTGTGDDSNPCSRTAPCRTFAGALLKTAAGGEISVMGPGGYEQVTINKAITINGNGHLASIITDGFGINIAAGMNDRVIIRGVSINGLNLGNAGIKITSGNVTIDKCAISGITKGFVGGMGIVVTPSNLAHVDIRDTAITNVSHGVLASPNGAGVAVMSLDNVRINDAGGYGVAAGNNVFITIRNSFVGYTGFAGILNSGTTSIINIDHSVLTHNITAVSATGAGAIVRLHDVAMYENNTGLEIAAGATIATSGSNKMANSPGAAANGSVTTF